MQTSLQIPIPQISGKGPSNNFGGSEAHQKAELWFNVFPGAVLFGIIVLFFVSIIFSRKQPLKSRGFTPFFLSFVLFIKIIIDIVLHITVDCSSIWLVGV